MVGMNLENRERFSFPDVCQISATISDFPDISVNWDDGESAKFPIVWDFPGIWKTRLYLSIMQPTLVERDNVKKHNGRDHASNHWRHFESPTSLTTTPPRVTWRVCAAHQLLRYRYRQSLLTSSYAFCFSSIQIYGKSIVFNTSWPQKLKELVKLSTQSNVCFSHMISTIKTAGKRWWIIHSLQNQVELFKRHCTESTDLVYRAPISRELIVLYPLKIRWMRAHAHVA